MAIPHRCLALLLLLPLCAATSGCVESPEPGAESVASATVLRRGNGTDPESLDPHTARSDAAAHILRDLGEGLIGLSAEGHLIPGAARDWTLSDDGRTYTFRIREQARWSNGDPLTAADFVYSFRRLVDPRTAAFYAQSLATVVNAGAIVAGELPPDQLGVALIDSHTLEIELGEPTPYFLGLLYHPSTYPVHPPTVEEFGSQFARPGRLITNGAYQLGEWVVNSHLTLHANPHYWDRANTGIETVRFAAIPDETIELNAYRAGDLDLTTNIPPQYFDTLVESVPDEVRISPYLNTYYYGLNLTRPPFQDNRLLRQALSMAIDRERLTEAITRRGELPAYGWIPPGVSNYRPQNLPYAGVSAERRHAEARRLYEIAGYGEDNPLEVEIRYNTAETHQRVAVAVQAMWKDVLGFEATLINEEFRVLLQNMRAQQVTQVFRASWIGDYDDAYTFAQVLEGSSSANLTGYDNPDYDALLDRASATLDVAQRAELLQQAERMMLADHPLIPLYFYVSKHMVSPRIRGWQPHVLDYHPSRHLRLQP